MPRDYLLRPVKLMAAALGITATVALPTASLAHPTTPAQPAALSVASQPPAEAARVVDAFHAALARGDTVAAANYMADDAVIFEGGGVERSKAEYATAHLAGDAAFAKAAPSVLARRTGAAGGNLAWVASEGRTRGRYKGRDVDQVTTETMILRHAAGAWRITHVHWSSRAAAAAH